MRATSKEYAVALFALAQECDLEDVFLEEMRELKGLWEAAPEYADFLNAPCIPVSERLAAVEESFGADFHEYTVSFLSLLCEQGCADILPACAEEYEKLYNEERRVIPARVTSAVALTRQQKQKLERRLESLSGSRVNVSYRVDSSLLGGMTVDLNGLLMDGSLRGRLKNIREVMSE